MKEILRVLQMGGDVVIGTRARLFAYDNGEGELTIRLDNSLMGPTTKPTQAGLRVLLRWLDEQSH